MATTELINQILASKTSGDLYGILGLTKGCEESDIKKAHRKLALKVHPDKCSEPGANDACMAINHAHSVLSNPKTRENYDRFGIDPEASPAVSTAVTGEGAPSHAYKEGGFAEHLVPSELHTMFFEGEEEEDSGRASSSSSSSTSSTSSHHHRHNQNHNNSKNSSSNSLVENVLGLNSPTQFAAGPYFRRLLRKRRDPDIADQMASLVHEYGDSAKMLPFRMRIYLSLIPFLLLSLFTLNALFGVVVVPKYTFESNDQFAVAMTTAQRGVPFYVRAWEAKSLESPTSHRRIALDHAVEARIHSSLLVLCQRDRQAKLSAISEARGWSKMFGGKGNEEALRITRDTRMVNCDRLEEWEKGGILFAFPSSPSPSTSQLEDISSSSSVYLNDENVTTRVSTSFNISSSPSSQSSHDKL